MLQMSRKCVPYTPVTSKLHEHKNNAARRKSRLMKALAALEK